MDNQLLIATKSTLLFFCSYQKDIMGYHRDVLGEMLADLTAGDCDFAYVVLSLFSWKLGKTWSGNKLPLGRNF